MKKTYRVIEWCIDVDGSTSKKHHTKPIPESKAQKMALELNEQGSIIDTDMSKPIFSYYIEKVVMN